MNKLSTVKEMSEVSRITDSLESIKTVAEEIKGLRQDLSKTSSRNDLTEIVQEGFINLAKEVKGLNSSNIVRHYNSLDSGKGWNHHKPGDTAWKSEDEINSLVLNEEQYNEILDQLDKSGVNLHGGAGIGKTTLAQHIGYSIVNRSKGRYEGFYEARITCNALMPIYSLTYAVKAIGEVTHVGVLIEAMKLAEEHPESAFVIILDEINRCEAQKLMGSIFGLLGLGKNSGERQYFEDIKTDVTYPSNLYLIATSNSEVDDKEVNKVVSVTEEAFQERFSKYDLGTIFDSNTSFEKFKNYLLSKNSGIANKEAIKIVNKCLDAVYNNINTLKDGRQKANKDNYKKHWGKVRKIAHFFRNATFDEDCKDVEPRFYNYMKGKIDVEYFDKVNWRVKDEFNE